MSETKSLSERARRLQQKYIRKPLSPGSEVSEDDISLDPINYGAFNIHLSIFLEDPSSSNGAGCFDI